MAGLVEGLSPRERFFVVARFGLFEQDERDLATIGEMLAGTQKCDHTGAPMTREAARQLGEKALTRLRKRLGVRVVS